MGATLEEIKGINIKKLDIQLEKGGDFIYYEGVLLAHYFNKNNPKEHYFYDWCDTDNVVNRWMIYKVEEKDLLSFLNKKISSLELIQKNQYCYFVDIDKNIEQKQILICPIENIPKSYLPKKTAYFDEDLYEEYAKELRNKLTFQLKEHDFIKSERLKNPEMSIKTRRRRLLFNSTFSQKVLISKSLNEEGKYEIKFINDNDTLKILEIKNKGNKFEVKFIDNNTLKMLEILNKEEEEEILHRLNRIALDVNFIEEKYKKT